KHLRDGLDFLRDSLVDEFETRGATVLNDPWAARDAYIEVILNGDRDHFIAEHGRTGLDADARALGLDLLEIQYRAMLMYTSCGWFFDDIAGLEAVFVLRHAGMVIDLSRRALDLDLEPGFLEILGRARSNVDDKTGRDVYEEWVAPYMSTHAPGSSGARSARH
ncbi:MAG: DUF3536 domain-containing protein, partial [Actinomycetota bacterium]